ncbi:MAG: 16S rRNA (cytosine(1402)-N(4))-methyltransferase RsmH [Spirochaetaceae bacterium]|jgi:16S rRNA (cytosine1402-N4)-methyltransferase|nr:16S rRNA (cytosine(1402)-N(4))-methyltransferase RsmH [Spirochaetaceae bacterium]
MEIAHIPVLLEETLRYLAPRSEGELMVDATLGEGGHSYVFLSRFPKLRIIGIDADREIQEVARERLKEFGDRIQFYTGWSQDFLGDLKRDRKRPDTILLDLGVSRYHYEKSRRGFSFRKDEVLDMRIDPGKGIPAAQILEGISERDLADLIYKYGEERHSRRIARAIVEARSRSAVTGSAVLAEIVERAVPSGRGRGSIHPATRTFQALRIAVNGELSRLPDLLDAALGALDPGGRLGVISFHSLEDRIIKNYFREKNKDCTGTPEAPIYRGEGQRLITILTRKAVSPGEEEIKNNPPSRSAKLRVVEKVLDKDGRL